MKWITGLAFAALCAASTLTPALAQTPGHACAAIEADSERLGCYDGIFRGAASEPGTSLNVVVQSEQLIPARPSGRGPATMTVICEASELSVEFGFAGQLVSSSGNNAGMSVQRDLQTARAGTYPASDSNTALVIRGGSAAAMFLDSLVGVTNLTVRTTPFQQRSLSVRFRVADIEQIVAPVRAACE